MGGNSIAIVPRPLEVNTTGGICEIDASTRIRYSKGAGATARYLVECLAPAMGFELERKRARKKRKGIFLERVSAENWNLGEEGYTLSVTRKGVRIVAASQAGLFYGVQSLRQLFPVAIYASQKVASQWILPCVEIRDEPRFTWRGMHLDVARHFMPKAFVLKFIDLLALHKMNTFHWHLTEDQGWRIEIKKYPLLTEVAGWRDETVIGHAGHYLNEKIPFEYDGVPHGGYYTQEEIREVVAYATRRHIRIVPEIELPGHARAALHAYPEFASSDERVGVMNEWGISDHIFSPEVKTISFLKDIFDEALALFPGKYIHVGGDEAKKTQWARSARIKELRDGRGLKDMRGMQSWFIRQFDDYLQKKGRTLIGWDEILEGGLAEGAAVMSWRGDKGGIAAAEAGHDVVMAHNQYLYFDHYQKRSATEPLAFGGFNSLENVYGFDPVPASMSTKEAARVLGAQGQLWTEYMPHEKQVEYMAYPRTCALAETLWLSASEKDFQDFQGRMASHLRRLGMLGVNFRPPHLDERDPPRVDC